MLTNHTFVLTTPSWNIIVFKLLDKYYQMSAGLSIKFNMTFPEICGSIWLVMSNR